MYSASDSDDGFLQNQNAFAVDVEKSDVWFRFV